MSKLFLVNKNTGKKYEILAHDQKTNQLSLKGPNAVFQEEFDKDRLKKLGYTLQQEA